MGIYIGSGLDTESVKETLIEIFLYCLLNTLGFFRVSNHVRALLFSASQGSKFQLINLKIFHIFEVQLLKACFLFYCK